MRRGDEGKIQTMAEELITLGKPGTGELTEKKSVFIADASPIESEEEAVAFIASVRKKYSDCRHCAYAYMLSGKGIMRYSDDGEPQGTAGLPILDIIRKGGFDNAVITVIRYFGGILLGTGGLVRAYSSAAALAVKDAGIVIYREHTLFSVTVTYQDYAKLTRFFEGKKILSSRFDSSVVLEIAVLNADAEAFLSSLTELTSARATVENVGKQLIKDDLG